MLSTQPYQATRENGNISSVEYVGSRETNHAPVAPNVDYPATVSGESVFGQMKRFTPVFPGDTGLAAGQSTSNATGDVWLEVRHTTTAYAGLGIVPAANANADDTILGPLGTHQLHVDGVAGTIRLDNGEEVDLAGQTSLELTNENGAKAYVDVSGWSGVGGTVDIASDGEMSIDDWATATPITFSNDQQLTDADGDLLYVDTTGAVQSGIEPVQMRGTYDIFSALIHIRDLMLNTRELSSNDQAKMLSHSLDSLEEVSNTFTQNMTAVGGRLKAMDTLQQSLDNILAQANEQSAMLEDADIVQVATDLAHVQNFYTLTLSSTAKLLQTSLLDFVR
jgi:flagellin-like hook-associated protein FlgL